MNPFIEMFRAGFQAVPRSAVAHIARLALAAIAVRVEGVTTNAIAHEGEAIAFSELDAILARIEASGE